MMGVGLGLKNIQTWIWDGLSPCLVILVSLLTVNIGLGINFSVRLTVRWGGGTPPWPFFNIEYSYIFVANICNGNFTRFFGTIFVSDKYCLRSTAKNCRYI